MGKYHAYSEYKDSGADWLGDVPVDWNILDLKRHTWVKTGYAFSSESFVDDGEPIIRIGDIQQDGSVSLDGCKYIPSDQAKQHSNYLVYSGELLMAMTGATIGKAGWYKYDIPALVNQRVGVFKTDQNKLNYRFLWFVLKSSGYQEYIKLTAFGGAQPNISDIGMVGYKIVLPTLQEQEAIANFLDHETAKIDTLIEQQQQLIQLLKEKRQAVISHAVTKGLNPDAPMKDSGVEWLGEVPAHWSMKKLKFLGEARNGLTYSPEDISSEEEGVLVLRSSNVQGMKIAFDDNVYVKKDIPARIFTQLNDILICSRNGSRALIGKNALIEENAVGLAYGAFMMVYRSQYNPYLFWVLNSQLFEYQSGSFLTSTINQLTVENINCFEIPLPPEDEMISIISHLKMRTSRIDQLINNIQSSICVTQERRTALISAAVTGKIDVRNWQAPQ